MPTPTTWPEEARRLHMMQCEGCSAYGGHTDQRDRFQKMAISRERHETAQAWGPGEDYEGREVEHEHGPDCYDC